jgi:hypothetical protein
MARRLNDARLGSKVRRDRSLDGSRAADSRVLDDQERLDEFRQSLFQSILPNLPKIKGYHVIWLTTTNPADSIPARMRLGYEPVKKSDIPGFQIDSVKSGSYGELITVNEMVAFKLPLRLYQMYMKEAHHDQPLLEEEKLNDAVEVMREQMARQAKRGKKSIRIEIEEGSEDIVADRPAPRFARQTGER